MIVSCVLKRSLGSHEPVTLPRSVVSTVYEFRLYADIHDLEKSQGTLMVVSWLRQPPLSFYVIHGIDCVYGCGMVWNIGSGSADLVRVLKSDNGGGNAVHWCCLMQEHNYDAFCRH